MSFEGLYGKMNYKLLMLIPLAILLFSIGFLGYNKASTGEWIEKGIDLKGGSQLTINGDFNRSSIEDHFSSKFSDVSVREINSLTGKGVIIESDASQEEMINSLNEIGIFPEDFSFRSIGPSLGESALRQGVYSIIFAFIFMGATVLLIFKKIVPSLGIVLGAFTDLIGALAFMSLFGIDLSSVTFAGLLLIIGYSIDTDILLTTRILKRDGSISERSVSAMKTGMLMTVTTLVALTILYLLSNTPSLQDIALVLMIALLIDIPATWIMNLGILRWWRKE